MNTQISIHTEHGPLHGQLLLPEDARGLVVLAHAESGHDALHKPNDAALAEAFHRAGLATLNIDLLTHQEYRFPDAENNVPLLSRRLLECLTLAKRQVAETLSDAVSLPIGLCGAGHSSPVVVRVAALRDHDISAVVCRGGLIDLAGTLYLRSLEAPLLMLVGSHDRHQVDSSRRALQEVTCRRELKVIPDSGSDFASLPAFQAMAHAAAQWFELHFLAAVR